MNTNKTQQESPTSLPCWIEEHGDVWARGRKPGDLVMIGVGLSALVVKAHGIWWINPGINDVMAGPLVTANADRALAILWPELGAR